MHPILRMLQYFDAHRQIFSSTDRRKQVRQLHLWILAGIIASLSSRPCKAGSTQQGPTCIGIASFYGWHENGRSMANGHRFQALGTSAASRTLPLGTRARVTNLDTGRSAEVPIDDRGPYVPGRSIHVSLGSARADTRYGEARASPESGSSL
jgi:hypothetical protein